MNRRIFGRALAGAVAAVVAPLGWVMGSEREKKAGIPEIGDPYPGKCSVCGRPAVGGIAADTFDGFSDGWVRWGCEVFFYCNNHQDAIERYANHIDRREHEVEDANQTYWSRRNYQDGIKTDNAPRVEIADIRRFKWRKYPEWNGTIEGFKGGPNGWA